MNKKNSSWGWGWMVSLLCCFAVGLYSGCQTPWGDTPVPNPIPVPTVPVPNPTPSPTVPPVSEFPAGLKWLHQDVSGWPVTSQLKFSMDYKENGTNFNCKIHLNYDKARVWRSVNDMVANPWVIAQVDGTWYAATWEWLKPGAVLKDMDNKTIASHTKKHPLTKWVPKTNEKVGFFVSGLIRGSERNVSERTQVVWMNWPTTHLGDSGTPAPSNDSPGSVKCNPYSPYFAKGKCPPDWSRDSSRVYDGKLARPGEYYGQVTAFSTEADATNFRYNLRSHFEHDLNQQTGYKAKGQVNITVDGTQVTWGVVEVTVEEMMPTSFSIMQASGLME